MSRSKGLSILDEGEMEVMERSEPGVSGMMGGSMGVRSGITSSGSSNMDFVFVALLRRRSAKELALATLRRGERRKDPGALSLFPLLLLRIENMLRMLIESLLCPWVACCMAKSKEGDGGVATRAESSDDISDDTLSRGPRSAVRREKYLRPRENLGAVGEASGWAWKLGVEGDERIGESLERAKTEELRVRPRPFVLAEVATAGGRVVACAAFVADNGTDFSTFCHSSPRAEGTVKDTVSSESRCSSHAASWSKAASSPVPKSPRPGLGGGSAATAPRCLKFRFERTTPPSVPVLKLEELGRGVIVLVLEVVLCLESEQLSLSPRCTTALKLRGPGSATGGGDIVMKSSKSPEARETVEEIVEGKETVGAEVELLDGSRSDLFLLGMAASEVMEVELSFKLSVEVIILDEGS
jgi:hypothetical protein